MCGICGYIGDADVINAMTDLIVHRGPDDSGIFTAAAPRVALGMRRLSIIDIDTSQQPLYNEDGSVVIVYNGEIYNYQALRQRLIKAGHQFRTHGDTEVIIHAYEEYGVDCLQYLEGMFAFAIWDGSQLFIARDRLGIKPLFYTQTPNGFVFGSEVRCLLAYPGVQAIPNFQTFYRYFTFGFTIDAATAFENIHQLTPGDYLTYSAETGLQVHAYWRPTFSSEVRNLDFAQAAEQLRQLFSDSVRDHLISDVPVGITLSGGLDSSSVLAHMVKYYEGQIDAFTLGYGREDDEFPFADLAAQIFDVRHHRRTVSFEQTARNIPRMLYHLEEPLPHVVASTTYELGRLVHEHAKVTLIGEGGDELLAGYVQYRVMARRFQMLPGFVRQRAFLLGYLSEGQFWLPRLFTRDVRRTLSDFHPVHDEYLPHYLGKPDNMTGAQYFEIRNELPNNQLARIDRLTMAHSVEARVPFLDHKLVNFCYSLPPDYKLNGLMEKYILREVIRQDLPEALANRRKGGKKGTQAITQPWYEEGLQALVQCYLSPERTRQRGIFMPQAVERATGRIHSGNGVMRRVALKQVYTMLLIELWMQLFVEHKPVETLEDEVSGILST
jgi:asparagine synthase (glutamine-hydrolysing)